MNVKATIAFIIPSGVHAGEYAISSLITVARTVG